MKFAERRDLTHDVAVFVANRHNPRASFRLYGGVYGERHAGKIQRVFATAADDRVVTRVVEEVESVVRVGSDEQVVSGSSGYVLDVAKDVGSYVRVERKQARIVCRQ